MRSRRHVVKVSKSTEERVLADLIVSRDGKYLCKRCSQLFKGPRPCRTHLRQHYTKYACECGKVSSSHDTISKHRKVERRFRKLGGQHEQIIEFDKENYLKWCKEKNIVPQTLFDDCEPITKGQPVDLSDYNADEVLKAEVGWKFVKNFYSCSSLDPSDWFTSGNSLLGIDVPRVLPFLAPEMARAATDSALLDGLMSSQPLLHLPPETSQPLLHLPPEASQPLLQTPATIIQPLLKTPVQPLLQSPPLLPSQPLLQTPVSSSKPLLQTPLILQPPSMAGPFLPSPTEMLSGYADGAPKSS